MGRKIVKLWHAGFAVKDLEEAVTLWQSLGFAIKQKFQKSEPQAHAVLIEDSSGTGIELWQFTGDSPLNQYVGRHVAFKCDNVKQTAERMIQAGFEEIIPYTEGVIVNYIYLKDAFGMYFELAEVKDGKWAE